MASISLPRSHRLRRYALAAAFFVVLLAPALWFGALLGRDSVYTFVQERHGVLRVAVLAAGVIVGLSVSIAILNTFGVADRAARLARRLTAELETVARELARKNEDLEQRVSERTADLKQKAGEAEQSRSALLNVLEDLTSAKRQLEAARAYDRALLRSMADGVIAVDRTGLITLVNAAAERMLGISAGDVVGRDIVGVVKKTDEEGVPVPRNEQVYLQATTAHHEKILTDEEHFLVRANGTRFPAAIASAPIIENDVVIGYISAFRDITIQHQIERTKDEFVSLASHELRTPLTAIGWYAELLRDQKNGVLSPVQSEYLREIAEANHRMSALVDSLLNVSRLELGTFAVEPQHVNVAELVRDVLRGFVVPIESNRIVIRQEFDEAVGGIQLDSRLMTIIAQNLISNALKYTPQGGTVSIKIRMERGGLVFEVSDTGIGIKPEDQGNVFKKMYRADNARLADPEGSGLGLYMVRTLLSRIGGSIDFVSTPGKGSTFTVRLSPEGMVRQEGLQQLIIGSNRL